MADINGTNAAETIDGTNDADQIHGGSGADTVFAFGGDDVIYLPGDGADQVWGAIYDGGDGYDTLDASGTTYGLRVVERGTPTFGIPVTTVSNVEHLIGGSGMDAFVMLYNQTGVSIEAGAGNDVLIGGRGNDRLDGQAGTDFSGHFAIYRSAIISTDAGVTSLTTANGGTDKLTSIEYNVFLDGYRTTDLNSNAAQVNRLFHATLDRAPTTVEFDQYVHAVEGGKSLASLVEMVNATEDRLGLNSDQTNAEFVDRLYTTILNRAPDADGRAYWENILTNGASKSSVAVGFTESTEFRAKIDESFGESVFITDKDAQYIGSLYHAAMGREPDFEGFTFWLTNIKTGMASEEQLASAFTNSTEWHGYTDGMSNSQLVDYIFETALERAPNDTERVLWTDHLNEGMSQATLVQAFAMSDEHQMLISPDIHNGIAIPFEQIMA